MNLIKIAILVKRKFLEFYEIKLYRKQAAEQLIVKKYNLNNQTIIVDKEE